MCQPGSKMKCTPSCKPEPGFTDVCRASNSTRACWVVACENPATEPANRASRPPSRRIFVLTVTEIVYGQRSSQTKALLPSTKKAPAFDRRSCESNSKVAFTAKRNASSQIPVSGVRSWVLQPAQTTDCARCKTAGLPGILIHIAGSSRKSVSNQT